ncbi:MAG: hypothetical protein IKR68_06175 [Lachnospiraceae bacterium]|nr:hypothetical protein [Lachnospiraceae bacterium]
MRLRSYLRGLGIGIVVTALLMGATTKTEPMSDAQIKEKARALGMTEKGEQVLSEAMSPGSSVSVDKPKIELLEFPDKVSENESKGEESSSSSSAKKKSEDKTSGSSSMKESEEKSSSSSSVKEKSEEKTSSSSSVKEKSEEKSSNSSPVKEKSEEKSSSSSSVKEKETSSSKKSSSSSSAKGKETSSSKKSSSSSSAKGKETSSSKKSSSSSSSLPKIDPESAKPTTPAPDGYVSITVVGGESSTMVASRLKEAGLISDAAAFDRFLCDKGYDRRITTGHKMIPRGASQVEIAGILTVR